MFCQKGIFLMRAEIIATGTELLSGGLPDTNSIFLSEELMLIGLVTAFKTVVGDNEKDMEEALRRALDRVDAAIITGGLGPTEDDITRKVVAKVLKRRLVLNEDALKAVKSTLAGRGKEYANTSDRQALIPGAARLLANPFVIAPGFFLDEGNKFVAALPGVPKEMQAMFRQGLKQALEERFTGKLFIKRRVLRTFGLPESKINEAINDILKKENPVVGLTAKETGVDIRIIARETSAELSQVLAERTDARIREKLGDAIYGVDGQDMEEVVGALLKQRRLKLSVAESCTGGLIGARITNIPGSSEYFERGVVTYSNAAKTEMLGVPAALMDRRGAVSREVAEAMAQGIREAARTDLGLSVTGIAGPDGGSKEKPVGLVYISLSSAHGVKTEEHKFLGNREQIRTKAAQMALDTVRRHLIG